MVENIDDNVGRLLQKLIKLSENAIVIFLTDNGPQQPRYNAGCCSAKNTHGQHSCPCFVRWPESLPLGVKSIASLHTSLAPTLLRLPSRNQPL
jgi:arylsulfatase A-like enzyme